MTREIAPPCETTIAVSSRCRSASSSKTSQAEFEKYLAALRARLPKTPRLGVAIRDPSRMGALSMSESECPAGGQSASCACVFSADCRMLIAEC